MREGGGMKGGETKGGETKRGGEEGEGRTQKDLCSYLMKVHNWTLSAYNFYVRDTR